MKKVTANFAESPKEAFGELTDREFEVLEWLAAKHRNRDIAAALGITEKTVRNHVSNIVWKLQAEHRRAVILKARAAGLGQALFSSAKRRLEPQSSSDHSSGNYSSSAAPEPVFMGRDREWAQLEDAWAAGLFTYITGPQRVGKTRLMHEFALSKSGTFIEFSGRPGDAAIPYASYARSIRKLQARFPDAIHEAWVILELQRIVPSLGAARPVVSAQPSSPEATVRLCEAIAAFHVAVAPQMTGILVDDIEYFDQASAEASVFMISNWERFAGNVGEAQHFIVCFQAGKLSSQIEAGIRHQARAGVVALIELEPLSTVPQVVTRG